MKTLATLALFLLWLALSTSLHPLHLLAGATFSVGIVWLNGIGKAPARPVNLRQALLFIPWLLGKILKSGLQVSWLILHPKLPIAPRLIEQPLRFKGKAELVTMGNSITLTPGTITVEIDPHNMVVHALDATAAQDILDGELQARVARIFPQAETSA